MRAHKEDGIAALLECLGIARPGMAQHILRARFELVWDKAFEAKAAARAMTIHHNDVGCPCGACAPHCRVDLTSIEPASVFIGGMAPIDLLPGLNTTNSFHITEDDNAHRITLFQMFCSSFSALVRRLRSFTAGGSYSRKNRLPNRQPSTPKKIASAKASRPIRIRTSNPRRVSL